MALCLAPSCDVPLHSASAFRVISTTRCADETHCWFGVFCDRYVRDEDTVTLRFLHQGVRDAVRPTRAGRGGSRVFSKLGSVTSFECTRHLTYTSVASLLCSVLTFSRET